MRSKKIENPHKRQRKYASAVSYLWQNVLRNVSVITVHKKVDEAVQEIPTKTVFKCKN
jgi:hypothetical protein